MSPVLDRIIVGHPRLAVLLDADDRVADMAGEVFDTAIQIDARLPQLMRQ